MRRIINKIPGRQTWDKELSTPLGFSGPEKPMQFLLAAVNAKYIHTNPAIYSLRAYAGKGLAPYIALAEYTINNREEEILGDLYKRHPDVIGFSCYIWNIATIRELVREVAKVLPGTDLWLGGPEVSYNAGKLLEELPMVKGIMAGEGEETFKELLSFYLEGRGQDTRGKYRKLEEIPGLVLRQGKGKAREPVEMDALPFPYGDLKGFQNKIIYYETSRGCPFQCSYCLSGAGRKVRFRSLEIVKRELQHFLDGRVPQVKLTDRTFNCSHTHAMEIWRYIRAHDNGETNFHFEVSADILDEEELELLGEMRPGLAQLEIGVQSANDATIAEIHRTMDLARVKKAVRRIKEGGNIHVHLDLIAGLPHEDYRSFARSFDEVYALRPDQLQLGFLKVLKGSYMHAHAEEYGMLFRGSPPYEVMQTGWITYEEILQLKRVEEAVEDYYNSGQYAVSMEVLAAQYDSPFRLYRELGEFYREKGYSLVSHSRLRRAEILLEFASECAPSAGDILRESLLYDLYARENIKSRPSWAADPAEWKHLTRQYCKNGKLSHVERFFYRFMRIKSGGVPARDAEPVYMFDYTVKNPQSRQAAVCEVGEFNAQGLCGY